MELKGIMLLETTCLISCLLSCVESIRVDWNTNTGPIVPPTSTPQPMPQLPFRDPAPVHESQSNDIPNPNPYRFVMPPPSRPRQNDLYDSDYKYNKWQAYKQQKHAQYEYQQQQQLQQQQQNQAYGKVVSERSDNGQFSVPSLSVLYVPGYGYRYFAVVDDKYYNLQTNDLYNNNNNNYNNYNYNNGKYDKQDKYDKWSGKFNQKTKTYKAYENVKAKPTAATTTTTTQPSTATNYLNVPKQLQQQQQQQSQQAHNLQQTSPQVFPQQPYQQQPGNKS